MVEHDLKIQVFFVRHQQGRNITIKLYPAAIISQKIHLFAKRAVKRDRKIGSSCRQQTAYDAVVSKVAREFLHSVRSPKREHGGQRYQYIKHDRTSTPPVASCLCCWQRPLSPPVPPLSCSAPLCLTLTNYDASKHVIVFTKQMLQIPGEHIGYINYQPVLCRFSQWLAGFPPRLRLGDWLLNLGSIFTE